jgi:hypothetical protein
MTEEQIRSSITALKPAYIVSNWRVKDAEEVIFNALEIHGFKRTDFLLDPADGIQAGTFVQPTNIVAYVGDSGYLSETYWSTHDSAPHLHISYYDVQYDENKDQPNSSNPYIVKNNNGQLIFGKELIPANWRNPFDYSIKRENS